MGQWYFHQDNAPVHNSILVTDYLTKIGIKTVLHRPYSRDLAPCDFWLFPKLRGCRYETIEDMKEAMTKVIDTLTQEDFHGALHKLLERYNNCIAAGGGYFEGDKSFMCVLSIKVPIRKKSGNLSYATCTKLFSDSLYHCHHHHHHHQVTLLSRISLTFSFRPYVFLNYILCPLSSCKSTNPDTIMWRGSFGERHLWVRVCFSSSVPYVLFVFVGWFLRWEVCGRTAIVSWGVPSRICQYSSGGSIAVPVQLFLLFAQNVFIFIDIIFALKLIKMQHAKRQMK